MQVLRNSIMLLATLLLIACSASNTPEKVAEKYINAVLANDIDGVMATLYIPADAVEGQESLMRGKLTILLTETSTRAISFGGVKDVSYSSAQYNTDKTRATVVATIRYKKDSSADKNEKIKLIKTDDGWKISL
ncbi:MAG: DUF4878 domain-containing protein [Gammaproteobacteria bacterium]|nr:DUF4878 domain-containing protein [Gammaproteobacteria bacterium]